jgi:hypothetical protein
MKDSTGKAISTNKEYISVPCRRCSAVGWISVRRLVTQGPEISKRGFQRAVELHHQSVPLSRQTPAARRNKELKIETDDGVFAVQVRREHSKQWRQSAIPEKLRIER